MAAVYVDSSAIVKLAIQEPESLALSRYLRRRRPLVSSALARAEVLRTLLSEGDRAVAAGHSVLRRVDLIRINNRVLDGAAVLRPVTVRTLDAIHLATAALLEDDLGVLVTYDDRMADAAREAGYRVASPS